MLTILSGRLGFQLRIHFTVAKHFSKHRYITLNATNVSQEHQSVQNFFEYIIDRFCI